ncbi:MAG: class I SAM-dependent methyltransferase [Microthrixaceae bacterium]
MRRARVVHAESFWSTETAVGSLIDRDTMTRYEARGLRDCVALAGGTSAVRRVGIVGIGAGRELPEIHAALPDAEIVGWDISEPMVDACRRRIADRSLDRCSAERGDVAELRDGGPFDMLVAFNAALCYPQPAGRRAAAFANTAHLLRPGGVLMAVLQQRNARPDWALWFAARRAIRRIGLLRVDPDDHLSVLDGTAVPVHHYSPGELRRMAAEAGYAEVRIESIRAMGRRLGFAVPWRSPNPVVMTAIR